MGTAIHFEIPVDDGDRASLFYAEALGWAPERWGPMEYWTVAPDGSGGIGGALAAREEGRGVIVYLSVPDIDAAMSGIEAAGGERLTPTFPIPGVGWSAHFQDSEGNRMGLFQEDANAPLPDAE